MTFEGFCKDKFGTDWNDEEMLYDCEEMQLCWDAAIQDYKDKVIEMINKSVLINRGVKNHLLSHVRKL